MEQRKSKIGKLLCGIMDMVIVFIFLFPFLWMLSVSLQSEKEITTIPLTLIPKVPQWKNYVEAFASAPFLLYLRNSVLVILGVVVIQLLVMIPAAYAFAKMQFAGKNLCFGLVMIAFMTHILLDLPNCKGIQLFWPIPGHHCFKLCASNGWVNRILCLAGTVMAINLFTGFAGISIFNWIIKK